MYLEAVSALRGFKCVCVWRYGEKQEYGEMESAEREYVQIKMGMIG